MWKQRLRACECVCGRLCESYISTVVKGAAAAALLTVIKGEEAERLYIDNMHRLLLVVVLVVIEVVV